jgi:hypothetical protein
MWRVLPLSRTIIVAATLALTFGAAPLPAAATSPGTNGSIALYGGNAIKFVDPSDGSAQLYDQNTDYTNTFFDVTGDGQNIMTMFQRYGGIDHHYYNSNLEILDPQTSQAVTFGLDDTYYNTMSPDGTTLSFYDKDSNYMQFYDLGTASFYDFQIPTYQYPVWSPDSEKLAYYKYDFNNLAAGAYGAYTDFRTGQSTSIPAATGMPLDWSPDGNKIAFKTNSNGILLYNTAIQTTATINPGNILDGTHALQNFAWSPDMQQVAFTTCDGSNNCNLHIGPYATAGPFATYPIAGNPGTRLKWMPQATANSVYRFWSPKNQHHFYTANYMEAVNVMLNYPDDIWTYEGIAYKATPAGSCAAGETPVYRFWSDKNSSHFFTNNPAEKDSIIANYPTNIWRFEGEAFCAKSTASAGYKPVYRFWSDKLSGHFFTTNAAERDSIIANYPTNVWRYEGVAYYVQ